MTDKTIAAGERTTGPTQFGARETSPTDAVPTWLLLEVPLTYMEAKALYGLKETDHRPDLVLRALMLRYIYGGESVRRQMLGEAAANG